jgi:hypothetical protein
MALSGEDYIPVPSYEAEKHHQTASDSDISETLLLNETGWKRLAPKSRGMRFLVMTGIAIAIVTLIILGAVAAGPHKSKQIFSASYVPVGKKE